MNAVLELRTQRLPDRKPAAFDLAGLREAIRAGDKSRGGEFFFPAAGDGDGGDTRPRAPKLLADQARRLREETEAEDRSKLRAIFARVHGGDLQAGQ